MLNLTINIVVQGLACPTRWTLLLAYPQCVGGKIFFYLNNPLALDMFLMILIVLIYFDSLK